MKKLAGLIRNIGRIFAAPFRRDPPPKRQKYVGPTLNNANGLFDDEHPQEPPDRRLRSIVGVLVACIALTAGCLTLPGCKTAPQDVALKSFKTVESAADGALAGWADHLITQRALIAAMAPGGEQNAAVVRLAGQEVKVRKAVLDFNAADSAAKAAAIAALASTSSGVFDASSTPATAAVLNASSALLALIQQLTK